MKCPKCSNKEYVKNGKSQGKQRYKCKICGATWTNEQDTGINVNLEDKKDLINYILDRKKVSLTDFKEVIPNKHINTLYYWRHKILSKLMEIQENVILEGIVQADETYFSVSYKGNPHNSYSIPRESHKRGSETSLRGISHEKIGVITAIDNNGKSIAFPICVGRPTSNEIYNALKTHIKEGSTLITDSARAYNKLSKALNLSLIMIPSGKHKITIDGTEYNLQKTNSYHGRMKRFISSFHGVSSKYLMEYTAWFSFLERTDIANEDKEKIINEIITIGKFKSNRDINKIDKINLLYPTKK